MARARPQFSTCSSVDDVLVAISRLKPAEKDQLAQALDLNPCPLGDRWAVVPKELIEYLLASNRASHRHGLDSDRLLVDVSKRLSRREACHRVKRKTTEIRDAAIDKALELHITEPQAILDHLRNRDDDEAVRKSVRNVRSATVMMRDYSKRKRERTHSN